MLSTQRNNAAVPGKNSFDKRETWLDVLQSGE